MKTFLLALAVLALTATMAMAQQVDVKMDKTEYAQFRINKIQTELNTINTELRKKNPAEYKRIDELIAQAQAIQADIQPAPAKAPVKE
jgi:hypothetical protein